MTGVNESVDFRHSKEAFRRLSFKGNLVQSIVFKKQVLPRYRKIIPYPEDKGVFESVYLVVYQVIQVLKDKDHPKLAIFLQRLESYIFIDRIAKELVENGIVPLTIHDSIIVKREERERALEIMKRVFCEELGSIPSFKISDLREREK